MDAGMALAETVTQWRCGRRLTVGAVAPTVSRASRTTTDYSPSRAPDKAHGALVFLNAQSWSRPITTVRGNSYAVGCGASLLPPPGAGARSRLKGVCELSGAGRGGAAAAPSRAR